MEFLALLPIVWLVVFLIAGAGSGNSKAMSPSPKKREQVFLRKWVYYLGYVIVDNAWFYSDSNTYLAHVRCPYYGDSMIVEASSEEELEQKLEELAKQVARDVEIGNGIL